MIVKRAPKRKVGRGSFADLLAYLQVHEGGPREDCVRAWAVGCDIDTAAAEMEAVAASYRGDPVYHVIASWRPGEEVGEEVWRGAAGAIIEALGAQQHQYVAAVHYDESLSRYHLHLALNRVSVEGRVLRARWDFARLAAAAEWCEIEYGTQVDHHARWRHVVGERDLGERIGKVARGDAPEPTGRSRGVYPGRSEQRDAARRMHYSWLALLRAKVIPALLAAVQHATVQQEDVTWATLQAAIAPFGVRFQRDRAKRGLIIVGPEIGQRARMSDLVPSFSAVAEALGEPPAPPASLEERVRACDTRAACAAATTWAAVHAAMRAAGAVIERTPGGHGRIRDATDGSTASLRDLLGETMPAMEARVGAYVVPPEVTEREGHEERTRAEAINQTLAVYVGNPRALLDEIAETMSTWMPDDVARVLRERLGLRWAEAEPYREQIDAAAQRICAAGVALGDQRLRVYSTDAIIAEECEFFALAKHLRERVGGATFRPPSDDLDTQQQAAYVYLADDKGLSLVSGIAGAGKSRLLRDYADAARTCGMRVRGVAVAGAAARVLGEEAEIATTTAAQLLADLRRGHDPITARDLIIVDEAGAMGTRTARDLLRAAVDADARVVIVGDPVQHGAVERGAPMRALIERYGAHGMNETRRAQDPWMRDVARDLRAGLVSQACDTLRQHGCVAEYATQEQALAALADEYAVAHRHGESALLIATRNADVRALNARVREAIRADLLGEERTYDRDSGPIALAVGDCVVARARADLVQLARVDSRNTRALPRVRVVNGDLLRVIAHVGSSTVVLERADDGARVTWPLHEHPEIEHGYAVTSYRSQGRTVDHVFALAANDLAGAYVDATRARKSVRIVYSREEVGEFGAWMARVQRDARKTMVVDYEPGITEPEIDSPAAAPPTQTPPTMRPRGPSLGL